MKDHKFKVGDLIQCAPHLIHSSNLRDGIGIVTSINGSYHVKIYTFSGKYKLYHHTNLRFYKRE